MRTASFLALLGAVLFALTVPAAAQEGPQPRLRTTPLVVTTATGDHRFTVEMAITQEETTRGLMFRERLGDEEGMLFDFGRDQPLSFWMRNTILPLDMVFIRGDGRIATIAERTTPYSLEAVPSRVPVRAVLEVPAGTSRRLGMRPGDRVRNVVFGNGP